MENNLIKKIDCINDKGESESTIIYEYNDSNKIKRIIEKGGKWMKEQIQSFVYDDNGFVITKTEEKIGQIVNHDTKERKDRTTKYQYEYTKIDEDGNWTERMVYINDEVDPSKVEKRIIIYYSGPQFKRE
ncbi:MAG: hypothetical protein IIA88_01165 [Bacteroidetes bacterium]|nr:hypothetical protein [Bacteroidota bacterium]